MIQRIQDLKIIACVHAQSCLTFCDPIDCSPPGFSICWIFQERVLEWIAISPSRQSSQPSDQSYATFPALQAYSLPLNHWGSHAPCNIGSTLYVIHNYIYTLFKKETQLLSSCLIELKMSVLHSLHDEGS